MHYTGMVYRPPVEANTPLLEITYGCSWNKCSFCSMYQDTRFGVSPLEHIESDLRELRQVYSEKLDKIFGLIDAKHVPKKSQPEFLIICPFALHILPLLDEIFDVQSKNLLPRNR